MISIRVGEHKKVDRFIKKPHSPPQTLQHLTARPRVNQNLVMFRRLNEYRVTLPYIQKTNP